MHCTVHHQTTQVPSDDTGTSLSSSCAGKRRIIFPKAIHDKYQSLPLTPIISRSKKLCDYIQYNISQKNNPTRTSSSSIEPDTPSLASLSIVSDSSSATTSTSVPSINSIDDDRTLLTEDDGHSLISAKTKKATGVRFDPKIWVHEFDRTDTDRKALWFTMEDLNVFKYNAMKCIMAYNSNNNNINSKVPQRNSIKRPMAQLSTSKKSNGSVLFSHPALGINNDYDDDDNDHSRMDFNSMASTSTTTTNVTLIDSNRNIKSTSMVHQFREAVAENEIRNILIVDPQEICLKLYSKGLRRLFPTATIVTARNQDEALHHIKELSAKTKSGHDFDIIINDEIQKSGEQSSNSSDRKLFEHIHPFIKTPGLNIAVVASSQQHRQRQRLNSSPKESDWQWTKPPPSMNDNLRDEILKRLLIKRGRYDIAKKLYP